MSSFTFNKALHEAFLTYFIDTYFADALFHLNQAIQFNDYFARNVLMAACLEYLNGRNFRGSNFQEFKNSRNFMDFFSRMQHFDKFCRINFRNSELLSIFVQLILAINDIFRQHGTLKFHANNGRSAKICLSTVQFFNFVRKIWSFTENCTPFWEITKVNSKILSILAKQKYWI